MAIITRFLAAVMSDDKEKWVGDPESAGYHCNCKPTSPLKCGDENKCNCKLNEVKCGANCLCHTGAIKKGIEVTCKNR